MSTDPSAPNFDPLLALYSNDDEPPASDVKVFDNIAMFEGNLRKQELSQKTNPPGSSKGSQKSFSKRKKVQEEAEKRDLGKLKEFMEMRKRIDRGEKPEEEEEQRKKVQPKKTWTRKTLFTSMEKLNEGPYSLIHRIMKEHLRCNVYVRDFCGLRGVCSGYIVAFDRFANLAMVDVDETFRKPPLGKVADHQKQLSVSILVDAMKDISLGKAETKARDDKKKMQHRATTGVKVITKPTEKEKSSVDSCSGGIKTNVKIIGKEYFKAEVFHGGTPQLYHRHLDSLFVRGDSIVLVSLK